AQAHAIADPIVGRAFLENAQRTEQRFGLVGATHRKPAIGARVEHLAQALRQSQRAAEALTLAQALKDRPAVDTHRAGGFGEQDPECRDLLVGHVEHPPERALSSRILDGLHWVAHAGAWGCSGKAGRKITTSWPQAAAANCWPR